MSESTDSFPAVLRGAGNESHPICEAKKLATGLSRFGSLALVLLLLSGCSQDSTGGTGAEDDMSMLESILVYGSTETPKAPSEIENDIAVCMAASGFEYTPEGLEVPEPAVESDTVERRKKVGFSISVVEDSQVSESPNGDWLASASEAERNAWLDGQADCSDQARAPSGDALSLRDLPVPYQEKLGAFMLSRHPEQVAANEDWADCMVELGYDYWATRDAMMSQLNQSWGTVDHGDDRAVEDFRAFEIEIAVVEFTCSEKHLWPVDQHLYDQLETELEEILS